MGLNITKIHCLHMKFSKINENINFINKFIDILLINVNLLIKYCTYKR